MFNSYVSHYQRVKSTETDFNCFSGSAWTSTSQGVHGLAVPLTSAGARLAPAFITDTLLGATTTTVPWCTVL